MTRRGAGIATASVAGAAAIVAAGVAAERRFVGRARSGADPYVRVRFGDRHTAPITVTADDGVRLHVEVDGDDNSDLTVIFVHGFTLPMDCWHFHGGGRGGGPRLVFCPRRWRGASGPSRGEPSTTGALGEALYAVRGAVAPAGPVVLVGHSMGGMTV